MRCENVKFSSDEERWKAESDARTMKEYQRIMADPNRVKNAKKVITADINSNLVALGKKPIETPDKEYKLSNPATVGKLKVER